MKLSILIPSKRPEALETFMRSLEENTKNKEDIEIVILVDDDKNYVSWLREGSFKICRIHRTPDRVLNVSKLQYECYKVCTGDWIMLGNDDCIIQTKDWDEQIFYATNIYPDELCLIYPNDGMFGKNLACFPVISRKFINLVDLFPMPYYRYKVDDTIFGMFPANRKIFVENCKFTHLNDKGTEGYKLPDGRIYPIDQIAGAKDNSLWIQETNRRTEMSKVLGNAIGFKYSKVLIGVPTVEMARRAVFYDYLSLLNRPEGTIQTMAHGQSPARNRNLIVEQALLHDCTHVMFIDDDMAFTPESLKQLLSHDKDMVTGFYLMRNYPHQPIIFNQRKEDGSVFPYYPPVGQTGLVRILNAGLGFCLIKTEVFKKLEKPWVTLGHYSKEDWCDDIHFFNKAIDAGFELYCDLDTPVGHMASCTIRPVFQNGDWHTSYETDGTGSLGFPMVRPVAKAEELVSK